MKIGYLVPEFPGQTHIFFWREIKILESMGVQVDIISTKIPPENIMCHAWTNEAKERTTYLFPPTQNLLKIIREFLSAGVRAWWQCFQAMTKADTNSWKERLSLFAFILMGAQVSYLAKVRNWQHLHVHSCANSANIAMFANLISHIEYSITLHGPTLELYGTNQKQKWQYSCFGFVVSKKLLLDIQKKLGEFLPQKVTFVPMGVNTENYKRINKYKSWKSNKTCHILSIGRLNPVKGHKYLIEAIKFLIDEKELDIYLQIAGEDEQGGNGYHQELQNFIEELSLSNHVKLLGAISDQKIQHYLETTHIFALASLNEGIPVSVMEAMAMEVPVIVTNVGGVKELVDHQVNGILIEPQNSSILAEEIFKLLINPDVSISLGKKARDKVVREFDSSKSAKMLINCITDKNL